MSVDSPVRSGDPLDPEIVSSRVLAAPRERVFRAFTDPDVLARWWGPQGFTSTFEEFRPEAGGRWRFVMRGPDGTAYPMEKRFLEVAPGERIVLEHPEPETHRFRMEMTFADEAPGTRLTWRMRFAHPEEAARVREAVLAANEENFDRLAAQLAGSDPSSPTPEPRRRP